MIYIFISLVIASLTLAGIMVYTLEKNKIKNQPVYLKAETAEEVLERLNQINQ
jgi:hypothetical protein